MFNSNNSFGKVRDTKIGLSNTFCNGIPYTTANCQLFSALCLMLTATCSNLLFIHMCEKGSNNVYSKCNRDFVDMPQKRCAQKLYNSAFGIDRCYRIVTFTKS